jgi:PTS system mannose-specific IIC component
MWDILVASLFFIPAYVGRSICVAGFLERPITLGLVWWAISGQLVPALPLALIFELFWLDCIPIGSYIQPMPAYPYLVLLALGSLFHWTDPARYVYPLMLSLPLAYVIPYMEGRLRDKRTMYYNRLLRQLNSGRPQDDLGSFVARSSLRQTVAALVLFYVTAAMFYWLFTGFPPGGDHSYLLYGQYLLHVQWYHLYVAAAVGGLLALRIHRAYVVFLICMVAGAGLSFL